MKIIFILFPALLLIASNVISQTHYDMGTYNGQTITTCSGIFRDTGPTSTHYGNNQDYTITFYSGSNDLLRFNFGAANVYTNDKIHPSDTLYIYDGPTTLDPLIAKVTGDPGNLNKLDYFGGSSTFDFLSPSNYITFRFVSDGASNEDGWEADISCVSPVACNGNEDAADLFGAAEFVCNLNGYCGTTSSAYGEDYPQGLTSGGSCPTLFGGTIENNSWLQFEASGTSVDFDFYVTNCTGDGIQVAIFDYDGTTFSRMSDCSWSDGSHAGNFTVTASGLTPGNIYYIMVDGNAGSVCDYLINTADTNVTVVNAGRDTTICNGDPVDLTATAPGNGNTFTWTWDNGAGGPLIGASQTLSPTVTTTYVVEVNSSSYCNGTTDTIVVNVNSCSCSTIASATDTDICLGESVDISANGGTGYVWDNSLGAGQIHTVTPTLTTTYTVTMTDGMGCTATDNIQVIVNPLPSPSITGNTPFCSGDSVNLDAGAYISWNWSTSENTQTIYASSAGTYTVTVTDINGCSAIDGVITTVNPLPIPSITGNTPFCNGDSIDLDAGIYTAWDWSTSETTQTIYASSAGTYTVTVTDANGCTSEDAITTTVNPLPIVNAGNNLNIPHGTSTSLNGSSSGGSGSYSYNWHPADSLDDPNIINPNTVNLHTTNIFTLIVTDDITGCMDSAQVIISITGAPLTLALTATDTMICSGDSVQLTATPDGGSGTYSYTWTSIPAGFYSISTAPYVLPSSTTTYLIEINDGFNTISDSITIIINALPNANAGINDSICHGESTQLNASGGNTYTWAPSAGLSDPNLSNPIATPSSSTTYTVIVTDTNNCFSMDSVKVVVHPQPVAVTSPDISICAGESTQLSASGGNTYLWNNGLGNDSIHFVAPELSTTYNVTVTNIYGCADTASINIIVNPSPNAEAGTDVVMCLGESVTLIATGGTDYTWSNNLMQGIAFYPQHTNTYHVTVMNNTGCYDTDSIEITVHPKPDIIISEDIAICKGDSVQLFVSGGNYYLWEPSDGIDSVNSSTPFFRPQFSTNYTVLVTNSFNCSDTGHVSITINQIPYIEISSNQENHEMYIGQTIIFSAEPDIYDNYNFYINNSVTQSGPEFSFSTNSLTDGQTISVSVIDNGCSSTDSLSVSVKPLSNAFTPNGDGYNDIYLKGLDLTILNRWGQELYHGTNGWDGTFNGKKVAPGTYYYIITVKVSDTENKTYTGPVTLIDE